MHRSRAAELLKLYRSAVSTGKASDRSVVLDRSSALCSSIDPEMWFSEAVDVSGTAQRLCLTCPMTADCLADAVDHDEGFGVWGSTTPEERETLRGLLGSRVPPPPSEPPR